MSHARTVMIALVLVLLTAAIIAGWWAVRYTTSPQYSLGKLANALNEGDWQQVQVYADTGAIAEDAAEIVVSERVDDLGFDLGALGDQLSEAAKPAVAKAIEQRMRLQIARDRKEASIREQLGAQLYTNDAKQVLIDGDVALVTIDIPYQGAKREVDLRMQRVGRGWRVVAVENLRELMDVAAE